MIVSPIPSSWKCLFATVVAVGHLGALAPSVLASPARAPDRLLVRFRTAPEFQRSSAELRSASLDLDRALRRLGLAAATPLAGGRQPAETRASKRAGASAREVTTRLRASLERTYVLQARGPIDVAAALSDLRSLPQVEVAEPDYIVAPAGIPDDPDFARTQWALRNLGNHVTEPSNLPQVAGADIGATEAWDVTTGDPEVVVAVLDSGLRLADPEFQGRLWENAGEIAENGVDDDGNGFVDDYWGYNFALNNHDLRDDGGHGTAVASVLAANANNGRQIAGVDWNCRLMTGKVFAGTGAGSIGLISQAIVYAADEGADVINMSLGGYGVSTIFADACAYAHGRGVFLVAAMPRRNPPIRPRSTRGSPPSARPIPPTTAAIRPSAAMPRITAPTSTWRRRAFRSPSCPPSAPGRR